MRTRMVLLLAVVLVFQSGCSPFREKPSDDVILYNSSISSAFYETDDYLVVNIGDKYICDKDTLEICHLYLDPLERFREDDEKEQSIGGNSARIFASADSVYLLYDKISDAFSRQAAFTIDRIDMNSFTKAHFFHAGNIDSGHRFLGLMNMFESKNYDSLEIEDGESISWVPPHIFYYFVYKDSLYTVEGFNIFKRSLKNGKRSVLTDERVRGEQLACDGKDIYFLTTTNDVYLYSLQSKTSEKLFSDKVSEFYVTDDIIYYRNISDNGYPYYWDKNSLSSGKIADITCKDLRADDDFLYYIDADANLCRISYDGSQNSVIVNGPISDYFVSKNTDKIFYRPEMGDTSGFIMESSAPPEIYVANKDGTSVKKLALPL